MVRAPEWLLVIDQLGIRVIYPSLAALVCSHSCHLSLQTLNLKFHPFQAWESSLNHQNQKYLQLWPSVTLDFVWKGWRDMLSWLECCTHGSLSCGGCLLYYWGFFASPRGPRHMPCDVLYNQPNPHCSFDNFLWSLSKAQKLYSKAFPFLRFFGQFYGHFLMCFYSESGDMPRVWLRSLNACKWNARLKCKPSEALKVKFGGK